MRSIDKVSSIFSMRSWRTPIAFALVLWSMQASAVEYVTPLCGAETSCVLTFPAQPDDATSTDIYFLVYSGFPNVARVPNLDVQISGNSITASGKFVRCDDCIDLGVPPPRNVVVRLHRLPVGHYVISLFLAADPSYPDPPPVFTTSGAVYAGITISGVFDVVPGKATRVTVVEYYNTELDHYFMTSGADEISLLDAAQAPFEHWVRTGFGFTAFGAGSDVANTTSICRFFNDAFAPKSSHFYAGRGLGCETTLQLFPDWKLESADVFEVGVPDGAGTCPTDPTETIPIYRMYNNGMGGAPNHRYTTSQTVRTSMLAQGWVPEGYGVGVAMCAVND